MKLGYDECRRMPIRYRRWFIERIIDDIKKTNESRTNTITQDTGPSVNLLGSSKRNF
jgi:hypothetical protein